MTTPSTQKTYHFNIDPPTSTHQAALRILKNKATGKMFVGKMKKSETKNWEGQFRAELLRQRPKFPILSHTPVRLIFALFYVPPKSRPCKEIEWKVTKPDADNVVKVMMDALVAEGYIQADQQVADLRVMKLEWDKGGFIELIIDQPAPFVSV